MYKRQDVMSGVHLLKDMLNFKKVIIAVEDNKPDAIKILERIAEKDDPDDVIKVMPLRSKYPQGAEKMMILSATGRRVSPGKLPSDVGCVVMNVTSAAFISRYLKSGKPLVSRSLTVDGSAITAPQDVYKRQVCYEYVLAYPCGYIRKLHITPP